MSNINCTLCQQWKVKVSNINCTLCQQWEVKVSNISYIMSAVGG